MKNNMKKVFFAFCILAVLLISCNSDNTEGSFFSNQTGMINIVVDSPSARGVQAVSMTAEQYNIIVTDSSSNCIFNATLGNLGGEYRITVSPGKYQVTVNALNDQGVVIGTGSDEKVVESGKITTFNIFVSEIAGKGILEFSIDAEEGFYLDYEVSTPTGVVEKTGSLSFSNGRYKGSVDLNNGFHIVRIKKEDIYLLTNAVRIVAGQISLFESEFVFFGDGSFIIVNDISDTPSITFEHTSELWYPGDLVTINTYVSGFGSEFSYQWVIDGAYNPNGYSNSVDGTVPSFSNTWEITGRHIVSLFVKTDKVIWSEKTNVFISEKISYQPSRYVYNTLSVREKELYEHVGSALQALNTRINLSLTDGYSVDNVYNAFEGYLCDHPDVFWVNLGFSYSHYNGAVVSVSFSYTHQETIEDDKLTLLEKAKSVHNRIKKDQSDWQKLLHIDDYLIENVQYSLEYSDQSLWSVFINRIGVCAGFARTFQYLSLSEGIDCLYVSGYKKNSDGSAGERHGWCLALLGDDWCYFDPTWDNNMGTGYLYFARSEERICLTHIIDCRYELPSASNDSHSYSFVNGFYRDTFSIDDAIDIVSNTISAGNTWFSIELSTLEEYDNAYKELVTNYGYRKVLKSCGLSYSALKSFIPNRQCCCITFELDMDSIK